MSDHTLPSGKDKRKKNGLRTFSRWLTFLIFLAFAGFVAWTGWIQTEIPPETGALVYTKLTYREGAFTGGYDPVLTIDDGFNWRWERLIPTNMTLYLYPLDLRSLTVGSRGTLPSGDVYMAFMEETGKFNFSWELSFDLTYRLKKEMIPSLAQEKGVRPEDLETFLEEEHNRMERELYGHVEGLSPSLADKDATDRILAALNRAHPFLEITSLSPQVISLPDLELYNKARDLYFAYLETRNEALKTLVAREAPKQAVNEEKMKILEDYGRVLTEYPVLIDFFALDSNNDFGRILAPDLMPLTPVENE